MACDPVFLEFGCYLSPELLIDDGFMRRGINLTAMCDLTYIGAATQDMVKSAARQRCPVDFPTVDTYLDERNSLNTNGSSVKM